MRARQGGLATVEFAIAAPVLLLLMLAAAELGRAVHSYNILSEAVRGGARYLSTVALNAASVMDLDEAKLARTRHLVLGANTEDGEPALAGLAADDIAIASLGGSAAAGRYVRVSAAFDYRPMLGVFSGFGFGGEHDLGFRMEAASTMRVLR